MDDPMGRHVMGGQPVNGKEQMGRQWDRKPERRTKCVNKWAWIETVVELFFTNRNILSFSIFDCRISLRTAKLSTFHCSLQRLNGSRSMASTGATTGNMPPKTFTLFQMKTISANNDSIVFLSFFHLIEQQLANLSRATLDDWTRPSRMQQPQQT